MAYQFLHIESYARVSTKSGDAGSRSMRDVCAEAMREADHCPHVAEPQAPNLIFGAPLAEVEREAIEWAEQAKDSAGRKIKADGQCLLAGVISAPRDDGEWLGDWQGFKAASVDWLKAKYGDRLRSVIEHVDESHPHIHFYAVPRPGERFDSLHEGRAAMAVAKKAKQPKALQASAFGKAMRATQDDFHEKVAARHGMLRIGPKRRRLPHAAYRAEVANATALAQTGVWAEKQKQEALALAEQAKAEADRLQNEALILAQETIATASERAKATMEQVEEVKTKALADTATTARYKREQRELRDETKEELEAAKKVHVESVKMRIKWTRIGGKLGAMWRGLRWSKAKPSREVRAKVSELEANLHEKSVLANEAEHQLRKVKAENGIQLAHERAARARREFEEARRFKPTDPKPTDPKSGSRQPS